MDANLLQKWYLPLVRFQEISSKAGLRAAANPEPLSSVRIFAEALRDCANEDEASNLIALDRAGAARFLYVAEYLNDQARVGNMAATPSAPAATPFFYLAFPVLIWIDGMQLRFPELRD